MKSFRVLLLAREIPSGKMVTKRGGEKEYLLKDKLLIYHENQPDQEIPCLDGTRFLVNSNGDANVISGDTELLCRMTVAEMQRSIDLERSLK